MPHSSELVRDPTSILTSIRLVLKPMQLAYHLDIVLSEIPKLQHGTDGLIYTAVNSKYIPRTDPGMSVKSVPLSSVHLQYLPA